MLAVAAGLVRVGDKAEAVEALAAIEDFSTGDVCDWAAGADDVGGVVAGEEEGDVGDLVAKGDDGVVADVDVLVGVWVRDGVAVSRVGALGSRSELRGGRYNGTRNELRGGRCNGSSTEEGGKSEELHVDGVGGVGSGSSNGDVKR